MEKTFKVSLLNRVGHVDSVNGSLTFCGNVTVEKLEKIQYGRDHYTDYELSGSGVVIVNESNYNGTSVTVTKLVDGAEKAQLYLSTEYESIHEMAIAFDEEDFLGDFPELREFFYGYEDVYFFLNDLVFGEFDTVFDKEYRVNHLIVKNARTQHLTNRCRSLAKVAYDATHNRDIVDFVVSSLDANLRPREISAYWNNGNDTIISVDVKTNREDIETAKMLVRNFPQLLKGEVVKLDENQSVWVKASSFGFALCYAKANTRPNFTEVMEDWVFVIDKDSFLEK